jgi:cystathionine beta-lyase
MAELDGGTRAFAFTSGMAALAVALRLVPAGGHIVTGDDIYGGTSRLLSRVAPEAGVEVSNVDMCNIDAVKAAMRPNTKLVWMESPTNPRMQITDLASAAAVAKEHGALSLVDNSIMAPTFQKPLDLGIDICMTSATKFIAGHSDVTAGILSVNGDELADRVAFLQNSEGGGLAPFDCWLCLRGLKTMSLRMERQQQNAMAMAKWLAAHPAVTKINYPGLPTDPGHALHMAQASGGGTLLSFETNDVELSKGLSANSNLFKVTVSFGSTTSLLSLPCFMSHASIPAEVRRARGLPDDLVRISAGIEDEKDLIADLSQAMDKSIADLGRSFAASSAARPPTPAPAAHDAQAAIRKAMAAAQQAPKATPKESWYPSSYKGPR